MTPFEKHKEEAQEKWGQTAAYKEHAMLPMNVSRKTSTSTLTELPHLSARPSSFIVANKPIPSSAIMHLES